MISICFHDADNKSQAHRLDCLDDVNMEGETRVHADWRQTHEKQKSRKQAELLRSMIKIDSS